MATANVDNRISSTRVVFDGQSLNVIPSSPNNYPGQLMIGRGVPFNNVAISGISWTVLTPSTNERLYKWAALNAQAILVMCGGTTDVGQEGDTGATVYAQMGTYANAARAVGFDKVIATTITPSNTFITALGGSHETARLNVNSLLVADASNAHYFDAVVDLAANANLSDYTNATYYEQVNQTHWTTAGATVAAGLVGNSLLPMIN